MEGFCTADLEGDQYASYQLQLAFRHGWINEDEIFWLKGWIFGNTTANSSNVRTRMQHIKAERWQEKKCLSGAHS